MGGWSHKGTPFPGLIRSPEGDLQGETEGIMTEAVMQIRVNGRPVGLVGLAEAIEDIARKRTDETDEALQEALIDRLSADNYIPRSARAAYGQALLREFRKFLGEAVEDEPASGLSVLILGAGCARCDLLERSVLDTLSEMNLPAAVDHVTAPLEIAKYGVMGTPALVIGGKVVWIGSVPPKPRIKQWLLEAQGASSCSG